MNLDRICTIKLRGNIAFSDFLAECLKKQSRTQFYLGRFSVQILLNTVARDKGKGRALKMALLPTSG